MISINVPTSKSVGSRSSRASFGNRYEYDQFHGNGSTSTNNKVIQERLDLHTRRGQRRTERTSFSYNNIDEFKDEYDKLNGNDYTSKTIK